MSESKDGGPAFPVPDDRDPVTGCGIREGSSGMSLRDWFAGQALLGMTASPELMRVVTTGSILDGTTFERMSRKAYEQADAMLAARAEGRSNG